MNLMKLSVGSESLSALAEWQREFRKREGVNYHETRNHPLRADEILAKKGSIYWIIKNRFAARQAIFRFETRQDEMERKLCRMVFSGPLVPVAAWPKRPFQGWRYLKAENAPPDVSISGASKSLDSDSMDESLALELARLGLL